ncbi:MAG: sigma-70 family RNA polymerase sigma factor [Clostridia bacterium]|nr:sigma-70 family RNA polymerase sigma factor [Clostridia bacterium]
MTDYQQWSEERLVAASQKGDRLALEFLIKSYQGLLNYVCEKYFLKDGDKEDLLQEATIGLIEAVYAFSMDSGKKFKNFAILCITRELDSCIKRSNRKKHQILNDAIPIYSFAECEAERSYKGYTSFMEKVLIDNAPSPESIYLEKEKVNELLTKINDTLTDLEKKVLNLRISGHSYNEITVKLNLQNKSVDNAIQRIRKKMSRDFIIRTA